MQKELLLSYFEASAVLEKRLIGNWEFLLVIPVLSGWGAKSFPELVAKGADALKAEEGAYVSDGIPLLFQQIESLLEPLFHQILVRGDPEKLFEVGQKVKFVQACDGGHLVERDLAGQAIVDPLSRQVKSPV